MDDVKTVEYIGHLHFIVVGEHFAAVKIFIAGKISRSHVAHDDAEEVFLTFDRFVGIIESGVGIFSQVELAVHHAHPLQFGIGGRLVFIAGLHPLSHTGRGFG